MIFQYLGIAWMWLLHLIIPPPAAPPDVKIDPNAKCPACGHRDGSIEAVSLPGTGNFIKHTCKVCRAWWTVEPVLRAQKSLFVAPKAE